MLLALGVMAGAASAQGLEVASIPEDEAAEDTIVIDGPPAPVAPAVVSRDAVGRVTVRATRLPEGLVVDGQLDDSIYGSIPAVTDFVQQEPNEGELATEPTELWVFFDDTSLYVAAYCHDSQPDRLVANELRRDQRTISQNDHVAVLVDTFYDRRNGFLFQTNALGALRDSQVRNEGDVNDDWNTVWDVQSRIVDDGWTLEMTIPFKSLRYGPGTDQIWGLQVRRGVQWKNEDSYLSPVPRSYGPRAIYKFSSAATLVGVQVPSGSRTLEIKPYAVSGLRTDVTADPRIDNDLDADIGFDTKYQLTSGLVGDFTYNTDFAQVEEDDQQVNLTRFSLFFPEKREVFLEGQGIFAFGGVAARQGGGGGNMGRTDNAPIMFFSRRIGLAEEGVVPIRVGGRVTGRAGAYTVGLLDFQTDDVEALGADSTNFSVVRLQRDVLRRSNVGVIATNRSVSEIASGSNQLYGADANFSLFENVELNAYYARSRTAGLDGNDASYRGAFVYNGDRYGVDVRHITVQEHFNPEIGFMFREDFRQSFGSLRFSPRPASIEMVRKFNYEANVDYITDNSGVLESRKVEGRFETEFQSGDRLNLVYNREFEYLAEPFEISDDVTLPVGRYSFDSVDAFLFLGGHRRVSGRVRFGAGNFYSGTRRFVEYGGRVEITPFLSLEPDVNINWIDLAEGAFTTELYRTRVNYAFSARSLFAALVQYNSSNDTFSTNIRFRWEYQPGSDIFFVFTEGRATDIGDRPTLENRAFLVKLTRLLRF